MWRVAIFYYKVYIQNIQNSCAIERISLIYHIPGRYFRYFFKLP
jgi:hypothetical protein